MEHLVRTHHESQCCLRDAFQNIQFHRLIQSFLVNVEHVELTAVNQTIGPYKLGKKSSKRDEYLVLPLMDLHLS